MELRFMGAEDYLFNRWNTCYETRRKVTIRRSVVEFGYGAGVARATAPYPPPKNFCEASLI